MSEPVRVVVRGVLGRMGREVVAALCGDPDTELVGAVEKEAPEDQLSLPNGSGTVPLSSNLETILETCRPSVMVDFTTAQAAMPALRSAIDHQVNLVVGTTGFSAEDIAEIDRLAIGKGVGVVIAPNFALGAVMMMHLAKIASPYFDHAEIVELHHDQKADAPSGTALSTAKVMAEAKGGSFSYPQLKKETLANTRGGQTEGIAIHSLRLPGLSAHQEVIFGAPGQTLTIRHDTIDRKCYMPGVLLAVKRVSNTKGLTYGLDKLLGL